MAGIPSLPWAKRRIDITLNYGTGPNGDTPGSDVTLTGLRITAVIVYVNSDAKGKLQARIYGLPLEMINQLALSKYVMQTRRRNTILVAAGDEGAAMTTVFQGMTTAAIADFSGAPEVVFSIESLTAAVDAVKPVAARSYSGSVDAAVVMADIAKAMALKFENNGVSVMLSNPYFPGTNYEQLRSCAEAARISFTIERGILAIWKRDGYREQPNGPVLVSAATGMVGYPDFSGAGVMIRTRYNPDLVVGGQMNVQSTLTNAAGVWKIYSVAHVLESETPNGQWFTEATGMRGIA